MKKIAILATVTLLVSASLNALTLGKLGDFKFEKANKNVYIMHGPVMEPNEENEGFMNNPAIIEGKNGLIIVDPGGNYNVGKKIVSEVQKVSKKPVVAIFNTHKHGDHWFANKSFLEKYPKAKIYALDNMIKEVKKEAAETWYGILDGLTHNLKGTKPFAFPFIALKDGDKIEIDGEKFVMHHPYANAHTDSDILIEHINSNTLFTGDNIIHNRFGGFDPSSSIFQNIVLLEDIKNQKNGFKKYDLIVPGHGPSSGDVTKVIDPFLNYLYVITKYAQKAYDDGVEAFEVVDQVDAELKPYHNWDAYEVQMRKHLTKAYSEVEAKDMQ